MEGVGMITSKMDIEMDVSPDDLAEEFWRWDSEKHAEFFNHLGRISKDKLIFQLQYLMDSKVLNGHGRDAMAAIGNYAKVAQ